MVMFGADVAQLRSLATQFDRAADQLDTDRSAVTGAVRSSPWQGPDASRFRADWDTTHAGQVASAASCLRTGARQLRTHADQQERASSVDGSLPAWIAPALGAARWLARGTGWVARFARSQQIRFAPRWPNGQFRSPSQMSVWQRMWAGRNSSGWVAKPGMAQSVTRWSTVATWAGRATVAASFAINAWDQWSQDAGDPLLSTEARVTRATVVGATTAAGGWAGAWAGAQVGAAIGSLGGPVGAAVGAVVGGLIGGFAGSSLGGMVGDALKDVAGQAADAVSSWWSSVNPFK